MRRLSILLAVPFVFAAGCSSGSDSAGSGTPGASGSASAPVTLRVDGVPSAAGSRSPAAGTGTILMVKIYVDSIDAGEKFYGTVFGAAVSMSMGEGVHILTMPAGGPGLVLLKKGPADQDKHAAMIVQVPDLQAAQTLALANGAQRQQEFSGNPNGAAARSVDLLDPWGNQVEILQTA